MLVKLTNLDAGKRVILDMKRSPRVLKTGVPMQIDAAPAQVRMFMREVARKDSALQLEIIGDWPQGESYTLRSNEGPKGPKGNKYSVVAKPHSLREVYGQSTPPAPEPRADAPEIPHDAPNDDDGTVVEPRLDPVEYEALRSNTEEPVAIPPASEPTTAAELLLVYDQMGQEDLLRLSNALLKDEILPQRPKTPQIIAALKRQARKDVESR